MNHVRKTFLLAYFHMCARYRRALAGFFWVIANPILTFVIQALIFKSILKIEISDYPTFLLSGLMPWFFISQSLYVVTNCLVNSREVLLGFKIHPTIIVSSQVLDQFISFLAAFFLTSLFFIKFDPGSVFFLKLLLVLANTTLLFLFVLVLTNLVAFWHVFYRDVQFIFQFIMNLAFYLTPVFYKAELIPAEYRWIFKANLFIPFIQIYQSSMYELNVESWSSHFLSGLVITGLVSFMLHLSYKFKMRDFFIHV